MLLSSRQWSWSRDHSWAFFDDLGLGLGTSDLGLGLESPGLGLDLEPSGHGLGLEPSDLGLGPDLEGLVSVVVSSRPR